MNTIFMNSKNSKTSDPHIPLLNLKNKISFKSDMFLKKSDKYVALSNLSIYTIHGLKSLNYLMDKILYQIFKTILNIY